MQNPSSPLDTLRQLKEMLDAGALTPAEFEALKQRLVIQEPANTPAAPGSAARPPALTPTPEPLVPPPTPIPVMPEELPVAAAYETSAPTPFTLPDATAPAPDEAWEEEEATDFPAAEAPAKNSSLALLLSIGGVLVFLALVAYLALNQAPSERLSSTSQTAADSLAAPIETGPQAEPMPTTVAVPETLRLAPTNPAPAIRPRSALARPDSLADALPATILDSAMRQ